MLNNRLIRLTLLGIVIGLLASFRAGAVEGDRSNRDRQPPGNTPQTQLDDKKEAVSSMPVYRPPQRGAPASRVGGGTRGPGDTTPYITVITPLHTGYTSSSQPALYWYLSDGSAAHFEFALINDEDIEPMIDKALDVTSPGLHRLRLSDSGVTLEPDRSYQWSVAAVSDPEQRSTDILSSGRIRYVAITKELESQLQQATPEQVVHIYAQAGYWYDAFAALSELIASNPGQNNLIEQRSALLRQADLHTVATFK